MLSLSVNPSKPFSLSTPFLHHLLPPNAIKSTPPPLTTTISALILPPSSSSSSSSSAPKLIIPSSTAYPPTPKPLIQRPQAPPPGQQQQLYQPYRPPASPLPEKFRSLDTASQLDVLTNRLGLWFEFAPLISSLTREGFTSQTLEEITGIPGSEQNCLVVGAQVRESLLETEIDPETLSFFDTGGAELLYQIRLLSAKQRADAARFIVHYNFDADKAEELARAIKDFPRRRGDRGWESFDWNSPGDCLAFMYFRQSIEYLAALQEDLRKRALEKALEFAESENARDVVGKELEGKAEDDLKSQEDWTIVPVVRLQMGEVAEATSVVVLPVCRAEERDIEIGEAPWEYGGVGDFGVIEAEKGWSRWVVLPLWQTVATLQRGGVAVAFKNGKVLPWRENRKYVNDPILVVTDRGRKEVAADDSFYLVLSGGNGSGEEGLKVERGSALKEIGVKESLGTVVLVVRPPRDEFDDQLSDEDWD